MKTSISVSECLQLLPKISLFCLILSTQVDPSEGNLGQLIALIYKETNYKFMKLANYGNWCGKGGDLMGDGSFVDGCDLCCKNHDHCYNRTRHGFQDCVPLLTIYEYRHGDSNPDVHEEELKLTASEENELIAKKKLPACDAKENEGPSCKQSTCQCDMEFVMCLKTEPCPPERVQKRGGYWFLPW